MTVKVSGPLDFLIPMIFLTSLDGVSMKKLNYLNYFNIINIIRKIAIKIGKIHLSFVDLIKNS